MVKSFFSTSFICVLRSDVSWRVSSMSLSCSACSRSESGMESLLPPPAPDPPDILRFRAVTEIE